MTIASGAGAASADGGPLTWNELADLYKERTGGRPILRIFEWAKKQPDLILGDDNCLHYRASGTAGQDDSAKGAGKSYRYTISDNEREI